MPLDWFKVVVVFLEPAMLGRGAFYVERALDEGKFVVACSPLPREDLERDAEVRELLPRLARLLNPSESVMEAIKGIAHDVSEPFRDLTLVVEDNATAATAISRWCAKEGPTIALVSVKAILDRHIIGQELDAYADRMVCLRRVRRVFLDYEFPINTASEAVLKSLIDAGVTKITAISNSEE